MSPSGGVWVVVYFLVFYCLSLGSGQEILQHPENTTVYLNERAVFTCVVTGGEASVWRVNGTSPINLPSGIREDFELSSDPDSGNTHITLQFPARAEYNGTKVQCLTGTIGGGSDVSENATLLIQGPLSAVGDLTASYSSSSVTVNWTVPFSLGVTGVDHDIWYSVIIYNVTDENNSTVINCTDCINITDTYYTFTPNSPGLCQSFNFSIIPMNGAGQGERSHVTGYILNPVTIEDPDIEALVDGNCKVTFRLVGYDANGCSYDIDVGLSTNSNHSKAMDDSTIECVLPENEEYEVELKIMNQPGGFAIAHFNITTFDVQIVNATGGDNMVSMEGEFIDNSRAKGCVVVLQQCHIGEADLFRALPLPKNTTIVYSDIFNIPSSNYSLFVHDLEENGLPNRDQAYEQSDTVTVMEEEEPISVPESFFLKSAMINYEDGDQVKINCEFEEDVQNASCLLLYRDCTTQLLEFVEYHHINTTFPVNVSVENPEQTTFAILGRNLTLFDEEPIVTKHFPVSVSSSPSTIPPSVASEPPEIDQVLVIIAVVVVGVLTIVLVIVTLVIIFWMRKRKPVMPCNTDDPQVGVVITKSSSSRSFVNQDEELPSIEKALDRQESFGSGRSSDPLLCDDGRKKDEDDSVSKEEDKEEDGGRKVKEEEKEESKYATLDTKPSGVKPPLPLATDVKYEQIDHRATRGQARSPYAEMGPRPSNAPKTMPHIPDTLVPYVEVQLQAPVPVIDPPTVETVMSKFYEKSNEWREIAEMMEFDEDLIDEIDTNNDAEVTCLQVCVEMWVSKFNPSWDHVSLILSQLRERNGERALREVMKTYNSENVFVVPETSQTNSTPSAVVTGVDETVFHNDSNNNNNDDTRGGKIFPRNEEQQWMYRAVNVQNHITLQEDDPSLITCKVEDDEVTENEVFFGDGREEVTEMVYPVVFPVFCIDDDSMTKYQLSDSLIEGVMVSGDDSANDYDLVSLCVGVNTTNKTKMMSFRNTESVQVAAQQCSDYGGFENKEGFKQKTVKWMSCGIRLGFHGPHQLIKLCSEGPLI